MTSPALSTKLHVVSLGTGYCRVAADTLLLLLLLLLLFSFCVFLLLLFFCVFLLLLLLLLLLFGTVSNFPLTIQLACSL